MVYDLIGKRDRYLFSWERKIRSGLLHQPAIETSVSVDAQVDFFASIPLCLWRWKLRVLLQFQNCGRERETIQKLVKPPRFLPVDTEQLVTKREEKGWKNQESVYNLWKVLRQPQKLPLNKINGKVSSCRRQGGIRVCQVLNVSFQPEIQPYYLQYVFTKGIEKATWSHRRIPFFE